MTLEEMGSFFNARVEGYEAHILETHGGNGPYIEIARLIPATGSLKILDLGCGTGLELDEIFKVNHDVHVTGIDLAEKMLDKLRRKHAARKSQLHLVMGDYFKYNFEDNTYDIALSCETLHHFSHEAKIGLYKKIFACLKPSGFYIEADYMAPTQEFEDQHFAENKRIRAESGIKEGFYHYDTPCTVENQIKILKKAGFRRVEKISQHGNCVILSARK